MPQVAAGDITGLYYIVVAGLPWQCTWQRLKDFARNGADGSFIDIDHALVYPDSTDGWVRVKGKDNFHKALAHLDGGVLDHRCIVADGRNETQTTTLRDTMQWTASLPRRHRGSSTTTTSRDSYQSPIISQDYFEMTSSQVLSYAASDLSASECYYTPQQTYPLPSPNPQHSNFENTSPVYDYTGSYFTTPQIAYAYSVPPTPGIVYAGNMEPSTPVYIPPAPSIVTYTVPLVYPENPVSSTTTNYYASPASTVIKTEARKVIITQLPHSTSTSDLRDLLFNNIAQLSKNYSYDAIEDVEIATHADGTPRGHAFAVFESYSLAKSVVKSLDGLKFKGRTLQARFAKEGVEPSTRRYSSMKEVYPASKLKDQSQMRMSDVTGSSHKRSSKLSKGKEVTAERVSSSTSRPESKSSERKLTKEFSIDKREKHKSKSVESTPKKNATSSINPPMVVDGTFTRKHQK